MPGLHLRSALQMLQHLILVTAVAVAVFGMTQLLHNRVQTPTVACHAQIPLHLVQWAAMFETPDSLEIEEGDDITECSPMTRGMWTQMANLTVKSIQTT